MSAASITAMRALYVVEAAEDLAEYSTWDTQGLSELAARIKGRAAGQLLHWAMRLVDDGADPHDVRKLISAGLRSGLQRQADAVEAARSAA